jgi:hypothetical protein
LLEAFADEVIPNHATEPLARALGLHLVSHAGSPARGTRYIDPLPVDAAPVVGNVATPTGAVTGALLQLEPATDEMLSSPTGTRRYAPDWPPLLPLATPQDVTNPTDAVVRVLLRFADTFYEEPIPQVVDPFTP